MSNNTQPSPALEKNVKTTDPVEDVTASLLALTVKPRIKVYYGIRMPPAKGIRLTAANYKQFFNEKEISVTDLPDHLPKKLITQSSDYYVNRKARTAFWEDTPQATSDYFEISQATLDSVVASLSNARRVESAFKSSAALDGFCLELRPSHVMLVLRFSDKSTDATPTNTSFENDERIVLAEMNLDGLKRTKSVTHAVLLKREFDKCKPRW